MALDADAARETPDGAARPGQRARRQHARRPRGAGRRDAGAGRGDQRADRRGARPRRHGDRLRRPRPRRRRDGDRPLGHRRAGGDLPAVLHRRGRPPPRRSRSSSRGRCSTRSQLETKARRDGEDWVLDGVKSLVARAADCELFVVAAEAEGLGPALFVIESGTAGLSVEAEPAMGLRPAATGRLLLEGVRLPAGALMAEGDARGVTSNACSGRGSPGARSPSAPRRPSSTTSSPTSTSASPSASRSPTARRSPSRSPTSASRPTGCGSSPTARPAAPTRARTSPARRRWRAASAPRRGCEIGSDGVQLLGGHGYVKEHPVERWYRDLRAAGVMEGALLV